LHHPRAVNTGGIPGGAQIARDLLIQAPCHDKFHDPALVPSFSFDAPALNRPPPA
jgi:hypothetical protein